MSIRAHRIQVNFFVAILFVACLAFLFIAQAQIARVVTQSFDRFNENIRERYGLSWDYGSLSFSVLRGVRIENITVYIDDERIASIQRINARLYYRELFPRISLRAIRSLDIDQARAHISTQQVEHIRAILATRNALDDEPQDASATTASDIRGLFSDMQDIHLTRGSVIYENDRWQYEAANINVQVNVAERKISYLLTARMGVRNKDMDTKSTLYAQRGGRIALHGTGDIDAMTAQAELTVKDMRLDSIHARDQQIDIVVNDQRIDITTGDPDGVLDISGSYVFSERAFGAEWNVDNARIGDIVNLSASSMTVNAYFDVLYGGSGIIRFDAQDNALDYDGEVYSRPLSTQGGGMEATARISGSHENINIDTISLQNGEGILEGSLSIDIARQSAAGSIRLENMSIFNTHPMSGRIVIAPDSRQQTIISAQGLRIGDERIEGARVVVRRLREYTDVDVTVAFSGDRSEYISLTVQVHNDVYIDSVLHARAHAVDGNQLLLIAHALFPHRIPRVRIIEDERALVDIESTITISRYAFSFTTTSARIVGEQSQHEYLTIVGRGDETGMSFDEIAIRTREREVIAGSVVITRISPGSYDINCALSGEQNRYDTVLRYRRGQFVRIVRSENARGIILLNHSDGIRYSLTLRNMPIRYNNYQGLVNTSFVGYYDTATDWQIEQGSLTVDIINQSVGADRPQRVVASIQADANVIFINNVQYIDHISPLEGKGEFRYGEAVSEFYLELHNELESEHIMVNASFPRDDPLAFAGRVVADNITARRLLNGQANIRGGISAVVDFNAMSENIEILGDISTNDLHVGTAPLTLAGNIAVRDNTFELSISQSDFFGFTINESVINYDFESGDFFANFPITQQERQSIILSDPTVVSSQYPLINAKLSITGSMARNSAGELTHLNEAKIDLAHSDGFRDEPLIINVVNDEIERWYNVVGGDENSFVGRIYSDNSFEMSAVAPFPVQFNALGIISREKVDVAILDIAIDIDAIPRIVDLGFMRFTAGNLSGSVRIVSVADTSDVHVFGAIVTTDLFLDLTYIPYTVGPIDGYIILQEKEIRLSRFFAPIEDDWGGYIDGYFVVDKGILTEYRVHLETVGQQLFPAQYDFNAVAYDLLAHGEVVLEGTPAGLDIRGELVAESGELIVRRTRPGGNGNTRGFRGINSIDLAFTSGTQIEIIWPSENFPIIRSLPELGQRITFQFPEGGNRPIIRGALNFRGGEISFFGRDFSITEGSVVMNEIDGRLDPLIDVVAELRELSRSGPVTLLLIIEDDFLSQLAPRLESSPPLTQAEISRLVGGGNVTIGFTGAEDTLDAQGTLEFAGEFLARLTVLNDFENSLRSVLNFFDTVTIRTQLFQNVIFDITNINESYYTSTDTLTRYLNNTNLLLGKYIADNLFFQLELGLQDEDINQYNIGDNRLDFNTELSFELQSPFGLIGWHLSPEFGAPFRINNTVEFGWNFVY